MLAAFQLLTLHMSAEAIVSLPDGYAPAAKDDASRTVQLNALQCFEQLADGSAPEPWQVVSKDIVFDAAGFVEIDLTAAPIVGAEDAQGEPADNESLLGGRLFFAYFTTIRADGAANAGNVTIKPGAANGYNLFGASGLLVQPPDARDLRFVKSAALPAVSAGAKVIRFEGAQNDQIRVLLVFEQ